MALHFSRIALLWPDLPKHYTCTETKGRITSPVRKKRMRMTSGTKRGQFNMLLCNAFILQLQLISSRQVNMQPPSRPVY